VIANGDSSCATKIGPTKLRRIMISVNVLPKNTKKKISARPTSSGETIMLIWKSMCA
jgi:hypothetical protein